MKFLLFFLLFISALAYAQDEPSVRSLLSFKAQSQLAHADRIRAEADGMMREVRDLNSRINSMQRDSMGASRKAKKQIVSLQSISWKKHVEASALYEKSNSIRYDVYKKSLEKFWKEHDGQESNYLDAKMWEEQARDNYSQAAVYRRNTRHMNLGNVKVEKLSEADNLEASAIRRQVSSLSLCFGKAGGKASDEPVAEAKEPAADSVAKITPPPVAEVQPEVIPVAPVPAKSPEPVAVRDTAFDSQVLFRVQIAANKAPFSFAELKKLYAGNNPVEVVQEAGWYKYQFIGVPMFSDASALLRESGVKTAFVVAYRNNVRINISEAVKDNRELEKRIPAEGKEKLVREILYQIELAVSKTPLKPDDIVKLYSGPLPVLVIMENGQYAYHLFAGYSAEDANAIRESTGNGNTPVVAYRNGRRAGGL